MKQTEQTEQIEQTEQMEQMKRSEQMKRLEQTEQMKGKIIRIGSRESRLAIIQTEIVAKQLKQVLPGVQIEIVTMKTTGDLILNQPLDQIGGKGLFVKELDQALIEGRCDLTVHSLKDMPMELPKELPILAYIKREDPRDVLVLREGLKALPQSPVIGTGSKRRQLQAASFFPGAQFKGIRGNLETRLRKLDQGEYDALILAAAGMKRLGLAGRISRTFSANEMIPSAGQGILAVQGRRGAGFEYVKLIDDSQARIVALAERAFVRELDGGCSLPTAAYAALQEKSLVLNGFYYDETTGECRRQAVTGPALSCEKIGAELALSIRGGVVR